jgi:hypothetical protein
LKLETPPCLPNSSWNGQKILNTLLANSSQNALTQNWKTNPACKDLSQKLCTNPKLENQSCLQEFKSEKNASLKIGKPTLLLTISSQKFNNNIERKNHVCNCACNRSNSECNNHIGKTICGVAEKRGIEKAYNFFFHKQISECHKNNHTEKKKKNKTSSLNELLQDADHFPFSRLMILQSLSTLTQFNFNFFYSTLTQRIYHIYDSSLFKLPNMVQTP